MSSFCCIWLLFTFTFFYSFCCFVFTKLVILADVFVYLLCGYVIFSYTNCVTIVNPNSLFLYYSTYTQILYFLYFTLLSYRYEQSQIYKNNYNLLLLCIYILLFVLDYFVYHYNPTGCDCK